MAFAFACVLLGILFGSGLTLQLFVIPLLVGRVQDRSTVSRISNDSLRRHHFLSVLLLVPAGILFYASDHFPGAMISTILLLLNLYQRFWVFTKLHLVKQPIGVQDLIQPDNVLREEFNRLHRRVYILFKVHLVLLMVGVLLCAIRY
jgi:hypothetical protein